MSDGAEDFVVVADDNGTEYEIIPTDREVEDAERKANRDAAEKRSEEERVRRVSIGNLNAVKEQLE